MRRFGGTFAVLVAALAAVVLPPFTKIARAEDGLRWETTATYVFDSPNGVVHASIDVSLRNTLQNETDGNVIRKPYFSGVSIPVPPDAANLAAFGDDTPLSVSVTPSEEGGYQIADIDLARNLFAGQTVHLLVNYDLTGAAPRSDTPERINAAYASFGAYGLGDPGLTTVRVVIPEAFQFDSFGDEAVESLEEGNRVLTAANLENPDEWFMFVSARNDEALVSTPGTAGEVAFDVRGWPNDPEWAQFTSTTITTGLPALTGLIGLPWPIDHTLEVRETVTPYLYGYAGWFDGYTGDIEIGEDLDQDVVLHELSHAWFNSDLFADRWVSEGLAQTYSARTISTLGGTPGEPTAIDVTADGAVRLDAWGDLALTDDGSTDAEEEFGYNASWFIMDALADEVGDDGMRSIFTAADAHANPYAGDAEVDAPTLAATNWHLLLDLAEEVGGSTGFEALLRSYVATPDELPELDARAAARTTYDALQTSGGSWTPPGGVRESMARWAFPDATEQMTAATAVLTSRDDVIAKAGDLGLTAPTGAETAYEEAGAHHGDTLADLEEVSATLDAQHQSLAEIAEVDGAKQEALDGFDNLGLTTDLDGYVAPARDAFEAGRQDEVSGLGDDAATEIAAWVEAGDLLGTTATNVAADRGFFASVGLRGTDLDAMMAEARQAFTDGDRQQATDIAHEVQKKLDDAESVGKTRVLMGAGGVVGLLLLAALVTLALRRRSRRRRDARSEPATPVAEVPASEGPVADGSAPEEQPVGVVVGGVEELDGELVEGHVAGGAEAGEGGEHRQLPPPADIEHQRDE
jgi:hypothetical protein